MRTCRNENGFTLAELLIALVLMGLVSTQLMLAFNAQQRTYTSTDRALEVQEDARLIVDLMSFDTRVAGFMVPASVAVSSEDGGTDDPDRFCVSDTSYFSVPGPGGISPEFDNRVENFSGAVASGSGTVLTLNTLDIDGANGTNDFTVNAGVIFSDGLQSFCRVITSINPGSNQITLANGGFGAVTASTIVPAVVYEVDPTNLTLSRNGTVLANQVEDLQVEYWVDTSNDNMLDTPAEFPLHDLNPGAPGLDVSRVRRVRITVVTRSTAQEQSIQSGPFNHYTRPAVANRVAGTVADAFKRRRFQVSILPRNTAKDDSV